MTAPEPDDEPRDDEPPGGEPAGDAASDLARRATAPRPPPLDRGRLLVAAAWLVAGAAAVRLLDGVLGASPAAAAVLGAVLIDLLAGRAGVRWADHAPSRWARDLRVGGALGVSLGLLLIAAGHAVGWATVVLGAPGISIAFALIRVAAVAARDELLLRWLPIALGRRAGLPDGALLAFVVAAAIAPLVGPAPAATIALAAAQALLGARLALATGGAIAPAAAHAGLVLALGPLSRGGVLDVTWWRGDPGPAPHADGATGWLAVIVVALAAALVPRLVRAAPPARP